MALRMAAIVRFRIFRLHKLARALCSTRSHG